MQTKTPGVYIQELSAFTSSVVEVPTAVPVFIGFTEFARRKQLVLTNVPTRIGSMTEFMTLFGGPPPTQFDFAFDKSFDLNGSYRVVGKGAGTKSPSPPPPPAVNPASANNPPPQPVVPPPPPPPVKPGKAEPRLYLYYALQLYFLNGGGPCYILSVGTFADFGSAPAIAAFKLLELEQEPTLVVVPDAVSFGPDDWASVSNQALLHCSTLKSRFAILDVLDNFEDPMGDVIERFRDNISNIGLDYGAAYYPWIHTAVLSDADIDATFLSDQALDQLITALGTIANDPVQTPAAKQKSLQDQIGLLKDGPGAKGSADPKEVGKTDAYVRAHKSMATAVPAYKQVMDAIKDAMNLMPPAAGMAGVYARTDSSRGVFKAPAGTGILGAVRPAVTLTNADQEDLNIPLDGKAINAIRTFPGSGIMVWGARTLDGNSQDFRYINVRRTLIMLEQSIMYAAQAYVFEPNTSSTWVAVKSAIENFLTNQWSAGALAGSTPAEAFGVAVGLPATMTGEDVLDGYMRVAVKVAIVRPAEFIIITFQQQMQTS